MIGILFHIYTTLVLVNLTLWVILISNKTQPDYSLWRFFTFSTCMILVCAAFAIVLFGKSPTYKSDLFAFESPFQVFLGGLGWIPPFPSTGLGFTFGSLCMIFAVIGLITSISKNSNRFCLAIPMSIFLQALLIISGDVIKGYFAGSRQFLILIPFMILLTATGIETVVTFFIKNVQVRPTTRYAGFFVAFSIFLISAIPVLSQYYQIQRVDTRAVINWLSVNWKNGQTVYIDPGYESFTYSFYLQRWGSIKDDENRFSQISQSLIACDLNLTQKNLPDADYLITNIVSDQRASFLQSQGFRLDYISPSNVIQPQMIWRKSEKS